MKINRRWLEAYIHHPLDPKILADQLTFAGLEVEGMSAPANAFSKVVVAQIEALEPHPNADKLNVCQVNVGEGKLLQIVCGAKNAKAGGKFPCALIGADLGGGFVIQKTKLRGVESNGMMCSGKELGLASDVDGILPLPEDAPIGEDLRKYLDLDDTIYEIKLTPNRGDCLSVLGLAREISAIQGLGWIPAFAGMTTPFAPSCPSPVTPKSLSVIPKSPTAIPKSLSVIPAKAGIHTAATPISIQDPTACSIYTACRIDHLNPEAKLPEEIALRLQRCGMKLIHPVVDILNYVMLELGQPMHAFDAAAIKEGIVVRYAKAGETLQLLNDTTVTLRADTLVIADQVKPLAIAGIMGGLESGVTSQTTSVILEAAFFDPLVIAGKARSYGLQTDAAYRFERGVDPTLPGRAMARASQLITEVCGGELIAHEEALHASPYLETRVLQLDLARLRSVLGISEKSSDGKTVAGMLERLGFSIEQSTDHLLKVHVPSHRFDVQIPEDLMEEVARMIGYDHMPDSKILAASPLKNICKNNSKDYDLKVILRDLGCHEVITYSFISEKLQALFDPKTTAVRLANPMSSEMSHMRTRMWPGLVTALMHNLNRQQTDACLFEVGQCFTSTDVQGQSVKLGMLMSGQRPPEQWGEKSRAVDFYDLKGVIETVLALHHLTPSWVAGEDPALHPGQTAVLELAGQRVGVMGKLHPNLQSELGLSEAVYLAEIDAAIFSKMISPGFHPLSKFPSVRRDLAVLVNRSVTAADLKATVASIAPIFLQEAEVFDVYQGGHIESTQKSVAIRLIFQENSRTLEEAEVNQFMEKLIAALKEQHQAVLRE